MLATSVARLMVAEKEEKKKEKMKEQMSMKEVIYLVEGFVRIKSALRGGWGVN